MQARYLTYALGFHLLVVWWLWERAPYQQIVIPKKTIVQLRPRTKIKNVPDQSRYLDNNPRNAIEEKPENPQDAAMSDQDRKGKKATFERTHRGSQKAAASEQKPPEQKNQLNSLKDLAPRWNPNLAAGNTRATAESLAPGFPGMLEPATVRTLFYSFWRRLESKLYPRWITSVRAARSVSTPGSYDTVVSIFVQPNGDLDPLEILSSSGCREFDDAAINSLHAVSPIPNPPKQMIESQLNTLVIRFTVDIPETGGIMIQGATQVRDPFE